MSLAVCAAYAKPVTVDSKQIIAPSGYKVAITEADLLDYPCMEVTNVDSDTAVEGFFSKAPGKVFQGGHSLRTRRVCCSGCARGSCGR